MIPYRLPQEKEFILHFADLLGDRLAKEIIARDILRNEEEAEHLADFFWQMVKASNEEDEKTGTSSEYILEKIIITFMACFRSPATNRFGNACQISISRLACRLHKLIRFVVAVSVNNKV